MVKKIADFLCRIGFHKLRYFEDHPWCMRSIAGCDHYRCQHCGIVMCCGYPEHAHEHRSPKIGAKGSLR